MGEAIRAIVGLAGLLFVPKTHGYNTHRDLVPFLVSHNITLLSKAEERESGAALGREIMTEIIEDEKRDSK